MKTKRKEDDYQPRKQLKLFFQQEGSKATEQVDDFCKNFMVEKELVLESLNHLQELDMKKKKRQSEKNKRKDREEDQVDGQAADDEEVEGQDEENDQILNVIEDESEDDNNNVCPSMYYCN